MTWANGRQMMSYAKDGNTVTFTYDGAGNRLSKTVNGVTTTYTYVGGRLYGQQTGGNTLVYLYDANGSVYGFAYNGVSYYYHRNIQGDVLGIYDSTGAEIVTYSYDAWGLPTGMTDTSTNGIGTINPIRYRGYLYDAELGFYWLTTRFYDPEIGRFINADGYVSTGQGILGYNMYAYCGNDPVNRADPSGMCWICCRDLVKSINPLLYCIGETVLNVISVLGFRQENSIYHNCYSYAFGLEHSTNPGALSALEGSSDYISLDRVFYTANDVKEYVLRDMKHIGKQVVAIDSPADLKEDEYLVVLKTSTNVAASSKTVDYHFVVVLRGGIIADKPGRHPARLNHIKDIELAWDGSSGDGFYDSDPIYFAVKR